MPRKLRIGYTNKIFPRPLVEKIAGSQLYPDELDWFIIAYKQAKYGHYKQKRFNFRRYFDHLKGTVLIMMLEFDVFHKESLVGGLTHDLLEDSHLWRPRHYAMVFGRDQYRSARTLSKEPYKDYFGGIARADWWIIFIKLTEHLYNMRDMKHAKRAFKRRQIEETRKEYPRLFAAFRRKVPPKYKYVCDLIEFEMDYAIKKIEKSLKHKRRRA